jgi:hypothetical protein
LPTDYWLVHADSNFTKPSSWASGELRLTNSSFNMENAPKTSRGYFLGDYQGLAAAGNSFYALFAQAGSDASDPSNIWFRDPPPAANSAAASPAPVTLTLSSAAPVPGQVALDALAALGFDVFEVSTADPRGTALAGAGQRSTVVDQHPLLLDSVLAPTRPAAQAADTLLSGGGGGTDSAGADDALLEEIFSAGWDNPVIS